MNRTLHLATAVFYSCCVLSFAQTSTPSTEEKQQAPPAASSDKKQEPSSIELQHTRTHAARHGQSASRLRTRLRHKAD